MLPAILAGVGVAANIGGGIMANKATQDALEQEMGVVEQQYRNIAGVEVPTEEKLRIALQRLTSQGKITPEQEQEILAGSSQMEAFQEDPSLKRAQLGALAALQQRGQVGMTPEERAAAQGVISEADASAKARRDAILQQMQARGQGGQGAELAMMMQAEQDARRQAFEQSQGLSANASQRALQAIAQGGQLSGQMRGADLQAAEARSRAMDAMKQFDIQNRMGVQQRNVAGRQRAQEMNLSEAQRIADENIGLANQEQMYNKRLPMEIYRMQMEKAQNLNQALGGKREVMEGQGASKAGMWSGIGQTLGEAGMSFADYEAGNTGAFGSKKPKTTKEP